MKERETFIVGDLHGCFDELIELLDKIKFDPAATRLIFVGDLGDRGPKSIECVRFVRNLCEKKEAECNLGNHENKHIRYRKHEIARKLSGKNNPMRKMSANDYEYHNQLTDSDIEWMTKLPLKIHIKDKWWSIHGGLEPAYTFDKQSPEQIIRCRYVSDGSYVSESGKSIAYGRAVPLSKDRLQQKNTFYWTNGWNGPENILFGHCVHSLKTPLVDVRPNGIKCIGIDTGAVFGGMLTGFFLERDEFVQVKAHREYYKLDVLFDD